MTEKPINRRSFLKLAGTAAAATLIPDWLKSPRSSENRLEIPLSELEPYWRPTLIENFLGPISPDRYQDRYPPHENNHQGRSHGLNIGELQYYAPFSEGHHLVENGILKLRADKKSSHPEFPYTSAMITTHGTFAQAFGRFTAKLKIPAEEGFWPSFWLLPYSKQGQAWPPEIDIAEFLTEHPNMVHFVNHVTRENHPNHDHFLPSNVPDFSQDFHEFQLVWLPHQITWLVDGKECFSIRENIPQQPMYLLLNLAVGGWAQDPTPETERDHLPADFEVASIKVEQFSFSRKQQPI